MTLIAKTNLFWLFAVFLIKKYLIRTNSESPKFLKHFHIIMNFICSISYFEQYLNQIRKQKRNSTNFIVCNFYRKQSAIRSRTKRRKLYENKIVSCHVTHIHNEFPTINISSRSTSLKFICFSSLLGLLLLLVVATSEIPTETPPQC